MANLTGTNSVDTLNGTAGDDRLEGLNGNDVLSGYGGIDTLIGGAGDDWLEIATATANGVADRPSLADGGPGNDTITFGGASVIVGGSLVFSSNLPALLYGGDGDDLVRVNSGGAVTIDLGDGNDRLVITSTGATATVTLGRGADAVVFSEQSPNSTGITTINDFVAGAGGDWLQFSSRVIDARAQSAGFYSYRDSDDLIGEGYLRLRQAGRDTIIDIDMNGGGDNFREFVRLIGVSVASLTPENLPGLSRPGLALEGRSFSLPGVPGRELSNGYIQVAFSGTKGSDTISAPDGKYVNIDGGAGDDRIFGGNGPDQLNGGSGNDTVHGGSGDDVIRIDGGGSFYDYIFGGDGNDQINNYTPNSSYLRGEAGDDNISGGGGFDDIHGNQGNDTLSGGWGEDWVVGGQGNDLQYGGEGADVVWGNMGNDTLNGGSGADNVRGGQGDDVILGGDGDDYVSGDLGSDTITGGAGADRFHTWGGAGLDRVTDFNQAEGDRVMLDPGTSFTTAQVGADTVITMVGGAQMVLVGVQLSSLTPGWIYESWT